MSARTVRERAGQLRLGAEPRIVRETASTALIDNRLAHGLSIPESLRATIREIATAAGAPFLLAGDQAP